MSVPARGRPAREPVGDGILQARGLPRTEDARFDADREAPPQLVVDGGQDFETHRRAAARTGHEGGDRR